MKEIQTPQKEQSRSLDQANRRSKDSQLRKLHKNTKKSLNSVFTTVSEDIYPETTKDFINFSTISEVSDGNNIDEAAQSLRLVSFPASSEKPTPSQLYPSSQSSTYKNESGDVSSELLGLNVREALEISSVEAGMVVNLLKQARSCVLNSADVDSRSKKLLDGLIEMVINEFFTLPEENDWFLKLSVVKARIIFIYFLLWTLAIAAAIVFSYGAKSSSSGPPPT